MMITKQTLGMGSIDLRPESDLRACFVINDISKTAHFAHAVNRLSSEQVSHHFADDILKRIFLS